MADNSKKITKPADITLQDWKKGDDILAARLQSMQDATKVALGMPGFDLPGVDLKVLAESDDTEKGDYREKRYDPENKEWKNTGYLKEAVEPEGQSFVAFWHNGVWVKIASGTTKARLTSNLDANGYATAQPLVFNSSSKSYDDDSEQDEITVYETMGCYCGIEGEIIEVKSNGVDDDGETIWEVVRGGATSHVVTLSEELSQGGTVEATVGEATISVTDKWLPSGETLTGDVGVAYNFTDNAWYVWVGAC